MAFHSPNKSWRVSTWTSYSNQEISPLRCQSSTDSTVGKHRTLRASCDHPLSQTRVLITWDVIFYAHTHLTALCPGLPSWAGTRKVKPIWILLKQETMSGSGISWTVSKSAPRSRQITMPAPHHSVFYRPDALLAAQPTASKYWRHKPEGIYSTLLCIITDRISQ